MVVENMKDIVTAAGAPAFPMSSEQFMTVQEKLSGMSFTRQTKKDFEDVFSAWVPVFNSFYETGKKNDVNDLVEGLEVIARLKEFPGKVSHSANPESGNSGGEVYANKWIYQAIPLHFGVGMVLSAEHQGRIYLPFTDRQPRAKELERHGD